ncbi:MAG: CoA-binding protein [Rhodothermales bacterium]|nr:CoA-binding protein [Rhodothermales bacterium]
MTSIAIVGASPSRMRPSNRMVRYLTQNGFTVIPINPNYDEVEGIPCHSSIESVPADVMVDVFDVFRNPRYTADTVREIVLWAEKTGQRPAIWTQLGVSTQEAQSIAGNADLEYISNRCLMVEHSTMQVS